jgi:hypothetical protein
MKESAALLCSCSVFLFVMPQVILGYMGYRAVSMHVFGLWFCWFVNFCMVQRVTVLNVFVGVGACYVAVGHCDHWQAANSKLLLLQKHSDINQQTNKTINQTQQGPSSQ